MAENPTTTLTVFVITEVNWSYNDEYSYSEGDAGRPVLAFTTKEAAILECERKNISAIRNDDNLCNYQSNDGWEALAGSEGIEELKAFCTLIGCEVDEGSLRIPAAVSFENCQKLLKKICLRFYEVSEIALDNPAAVTPVSALMEKDPEPEPEPEPPPPKPPEPLFKKNILMEDE